MHETYLGVGLESEPLLDRREEAREAAAAATAAATGAVADVPGGSDVEGGGCRGDVGGQVLDLTSDPLGRGRHPRLRRRRDRLGDELGGGGARLLPVVLVSGEELLGAERLAVGRLGGRLPLVPRAGDAAAARLADVGGGDVGREEVLGRVLLLKTLQVIWEAGQS